MKITWLGQAGLLFENGSVKIMIDPYLSDSVKKVNPKNYRRVPVLESLFDVKPDIMIFAHNHLDHYDPEPVQKFITPQTAMTVLAPASVWSEVRKIGGSNNYVLFNPRISWTEHGIQFTSVKAEHSDPTPIGVIIDSGDKKYYITGDTLYNEEFLKDIPDDIYAVFLPVNGVGNNMNMADVKRFCSMIHPDFAVPMHCGMFDEIDMHAFTFENKIIPEIYKEVNFI